MKRLAPIDSLNISFISNKYFYIYDSLLKILCTECRGNVLIQFDSYLTLESNKLQIFPNKFFPNNTKELS